MQPRSSQAYGQPLLGDYDHSTMQRSNKVAQHPRLGEYDDEREPKPRGGVRVQRGWDVERGVSRVGDEGDYVTPGTEQLCSTNTASTGSSGSSVASDTDSSGER